MNAPHIILDNLPSLCQKLSDLVEVRRSYNKNNFACFLPARRYASAGYSDRNVSVRLSVCPSVCLSVTSRYCVKTKKASGMISSPSGSPKTLVF